MTDDFKVHYDYLSDEVDKFKDEADDYILYLPGFFKLLCSLLNTPVKREDRQKLACAMDYFVTPDDIIPEDVFGHIGYVDDVFICCHVLKEMEEKYGLDWSPTGSTRTSWT